MASRDRVTSTFAPDLEEVRAWLGKMIAALRFAELVAAILALIGRMRDLYKVDEYFLWHHVGYFPQEVEMAMLREFADAVIKM